MLPFVPFIALVSIIGGGVTLFWYHSLSHEEKKRADRLVGDYAFQLFGKGVKELTQAEAKRVNLLVRSNFNQQV